MSWLTGAPRLIGAIPRTTGRHSTTIYRYTYTLSHIPTKSYVHIPIHNKHIIYVYTYIHKYINLYTYIYVIPIQPCTMNPLKAGTGPPAIHHRHGALLLVICGLGSFGASWSEKSASGRMRKPENVGRPSEKNIGKTIETKQTLGLHGIYS